MQSRVWLEMTPSEQEVVEEARALMRSKGVDLTKNGIAPGGCSATIFDQGSMQELQPLEFVRKFGNKYTTANAEGAKSQDSAIQGRDFEHGRSEKVHPLADEEVRSFVRAKDAEHEYGSMQGVHPSQY